MKQEREQIRVIRPSRVLSWRDVVELWRFRELLRSLVERNIKVRYSQTLIGGLWAVIQPVIVMVVFTVLFGRLARIPSDGLPYPIFSFAGLILWQYFSGVVNSASNSLVAEAQMISKVYFPRMIVPLASVLTGLVDYVLALVVLLLGIVFYQARLSWQVAILPLVMGLTVVLASGVGFWFSSLNVKFRDVRIVVPFVLQVWMFLTPVIYPVSLAGKWEWVLRLNPLTGLMEAHRAVLLGHQEINWGALAWSGGLSLLVFFSGLIYFKKVERFFADVI